MTITTLVYSLSAILVLLGIAAALGAVHFGKRYKADNIRKDKLLCVCCTVAGCVCIMTAGQILWMFRNILWA